MRTTLSRMIFEDAGMDLVDAAADALLPLMLVERAAFEGVAGELLAKLEGDAGAQARVMGGAARAHHGERAHRQGGQGEQEAVQAEHVHVPDRNAVVRAAQLTRRVREGRASTGGDDRRE